MRYYDFNEHEVIAWARGQGAVRVLAEPHPTLTAVGDNVFNGLGGDYLNSDRERRRFILIPGTRII